YHLGLGIDAFQRGQELSYYHRDEQLSTAFITGGHGEVYNSYQYDAFGAGIEATEQLSNRIRYTGQQYDDLTGQYYLRARYYNPILGRFMQEDTYWGDGLNLYAYCANNPVMYYDPSGYDKSYDGGIIPSVNSGFSEWFDSIDWEDFDKIWKDENLKEYIEDQIRYPGKLHEWNMAGFADYFKYWGVSMDEIKLNRDIIATLDFINPAGHHGSIGSTTAHNEIKAIIKSSLDYDDFERRLHTWADYRLPEIEIDGKIYPGSARLPGNLQNQEAIEYIDGWYEEHPEEQNKTSSCKTK
ncbi:MAG: RHS repeat-associated core domain-containing protein, partial [Acetatifactor sp.]